MKKTLVTLLMLGVLLSVSATVAAEPAIINGSIDWNQGVITAIGTGAPPASAHSQAQSNAMARRAAIVDGYRNLAELIAGVRVEGETTVRNFEVASDVIRTRVEAMIKGARIISEMPMPDGSYQVTMQINLYGDNSVAAAIQDKMAPAVILPVPQPSPSYKPNDVIPAQPQPQVPGKPVTIMPIYTGVVVDARGLGLERVMSPRIYDEAGRIVYGNMYIDPNFVVKRGMVDYASDPDMIAEVTTGKSRAGNYPIIVKAIGLKDFNANVVISQADADKILAANQQSGFIKQTAVVFEQ
ncbi:MAG: LPP20 family lipoprotein [Negativicutes bacterium]|nr:LPP20 family lipoprotein [Negativicutes bacterium]